MDRKKLENILNLHKEWLCGKREGQRADLQNADLQNADLQGAYLQGADLQGADLQGAYLRIDGKKIKCKSNKTAQYIGSDYYCIFIGSIIKIGCEVHYRSAWEKFSNKEIVDMDGRRALKFWKKEKNIILSISKNLSK